MREWYREQLQEVLSELTGRWLERLGEAPVSWRIRQMRSEWGSCTARKRHLMFNLELARVPMECVEYVVVHELTHLAVQNHGPAFQALMTQRLPNWKMLRKQLNKRI
jgi:predicted metal-dependent hydrolase